MPGSKHVFPLIQVSELHGLGRTSQLTTTTIRQEGPGKVTDNILCRHVVAQLTAKKPREGLMAAFAASLSSIS